MIYYINNNKALLFDENKNIVEINDAGLRAFLESGGELTEVGETTKQGLVVTRFQMKMSLAKRQLYDAVLGVIASLPKTIHHEALVLFHESPTAHSDDPLVMQILEAIGLDTDAQKELFEFALTL